MSTLMLESEQTQEFTYISNAFIDYEMCEANGDFVKVYLYLLRCNGQLPENFSISLIADRFNLTENDVHRALRYWEKKNLLELRTDSSHDIIGIRLKKTPKKEAPSVYKKDEISDSKLNPYMPASLTPAAPAGQYDKTMRKGAEPITVNQSAASAANAYQSAAAFRADSGAGMAQDADGQDNKRLQEILFLAEQYLGKPLTPDETMKVYYFYDTLHFPPDLIEYLIDHCVSNGKKSMRYIEKVALTWAEKGILSVSQAKENSAAYNKDYFTILRAFGIRDRYPVDNEINYMDKWLNAYHFDLNIIAEACARTMKKGNQSAPFPYADTILTNWYKHGVVTKRDILALDSQHQRSRTTEKETTVRGSSKVAPISAISNQFNNFDQRSSYDYEELEKKLSQM